MRIMATDSIAMEQPGFQKMVAKRGPGNQKTAQPSKPISNNYQTITNAQDPSGFWSSLSSIDLEPVTGKLISEKFSDEQISATIYALILLLSKFGSQYNEWKLTAIKGVSFLGKKPRRKRC